MSVNDKNDGGNKDNGNGTPMAAAMQDAQRQQQGQNRGGRTGAEASGFSFSTMGNVLGNGMMGRNQSSEHLAKLNKAMNETITNNAAEGYHYRLIPVEKADTPSLGISALILVLGVPAAPQLGMTYCVLLLESTATKLDPIFDTIQGKNTEITITAGDYIDDTLRQTLFAKVKETYPTVHPNQFTLASERVVPKDFPIAEEDAVWRLAAETAFAAFNILMTSAEDFRDLNLAQANKDSTLVTRATFGNPESADDMGHPLRTDIRITLGTQSRDQQQNSRQLNANREQTWADVAAYLDIDWAPPPGSQQATWAGMPQVQPQGPRRLYAARAVLTKIDTPKMTPSMIQMAIIAATQLREANTWYQGFRTMGFADGTGAQDIGAIGIECNFNNDPSGIGQPIDTTSATFKPEYLAGLLNMTFHPGLTICMDVDEAGANTWALGHYIDAALGNPDAINAIIAQAQTLTNGNFLKHFNQGDTICFNEQNRIHRGYYVDRAGVRHDLRNIGYLAVLNNNTSKIDPQIIRDFSDTFTRVEFSLEMRLDARLKIIKGIVGTTDVTVTGFAQRLTFSSNFTSALVQGALDCGLSLKSLTNIGDMQGYERAGNQFTQHTLNTVNNSGMFHRGSVFNGAASFGAGRTHSRFGSAN